MSMGAKFLNKYSVADFKCFTATETRLSSDLWGSMGSCTPLPGFSFLVLYILADLISSLEIQRLQLAGSSSTVFAVNLILFKA